MALLLATVMVLDCTTSLLVSTSMAVPVKVGDRQVADDAAVRVDVQVQDGAASPPPSIVISGVPVYPGWLVPSMMTGWVSGVSTLDK